MCASGYNYCSFMATHALRTRDKVTLVITQMAPSGFHIYQTRLAYVRGGGSRTSVTFKMELFVIIVNGFQPLTVTTKSSILDVAAVLDPPRHSVCQRLLLTKEEWKP